MNDQRDRAPEEELLGLLRKRLAKSDRPPESPVAIAELQRTFLPYPACRDALGYATKAEYDLALLRLLAGGEGVRLSEPELAEAAARELDAPEPGLAFLDRYAAAELSVVAAPEHDAPPGETVQAEAEPESPTQAEAEPESAARWEAKDDAAEPQEETPEETAERTASPERCWRCRKTLPRRRGLRFCPFCGEDQTALRCLECGEELEAGWAYCPACGRPAPWE